MIELEITYIVKYGETYLYLHKYLFLIITALKKNKDHKRNLIWGLIILPLNRMCLLQTIMITDKRQIITVHTLMCIKKEKKKYEITYTNSTQSAFGVNKFSIYIKNLNVLVLLTNWQQNECCNKSEIELGGFFFFFVFFAYKIGSQRYSAQPNYTTKASC